MHASTNFLHQTPQTWYQARFCGGGIYRAARGQHFPLHQHTMWEWVYYRKGMIRCEVGDETFEVQPGVLLLTPPHTPHCEWATTAYENIYFLVDAAAETPWPRQCVDDGDASLGQVCANLIREWKRPSPTQAHMLDLLMRQLLLHIERTTEEALIEGGELAVRQAEKLLEERYGSSLSIEALAREIGVSPSYLREQFAVRRQCSPREFLHDVRLRHALGWLRHSNLTLENIAQVCGYNSASHLSRQVKGATQQNPGAIRAAYKLTGES